MRIAVTGQNGQVARALHEVVLLGRPALDLGQPDTILPAFRDARAEAVINAAAYTAVDKAESEPELAAAVNGAGAGAVAAAAAELGLPVLQVSTDYVFDGSKPAAYVETDPVGPLGAYGRSKLAGERAVAAANPRHAVLRTAWVYAPYGANFVRTMLRIAGNKPEVNVVADQRGCPTSALDIATTLLGVAARMAAEPEDGALTGVLHMAARGEAVWADVAASRVRGGPSATVHRITTAEFLTAARLRQAQARLRHRAAGLAHPAAAHSVARLQRHADSWLGSGTMSQRRPGDGRPNRGRNGDHPSRRCHPRCWCGWRISTSPTIPPRRRASATCWSARCVAAASRETNPCMSIYPIIGSLKEVRCNLGGRD